MGPSEISGKIQQRLEKIYHRFPPEYLEELLNAIEELKPTLNTARDKWSEEDCYLITYGDSITTQGKKPLSVLNAFLRMYIGDSINHVHILPFFPYTSDDGFSVIDYREVNPALGNWSEIKEIGKNYTLMFDLVINHVSQQSEWFRNFLKGTKPGTDYFISVEPDSNLSSVVRPRSLPLLTAFNTKHGTQHVWTTFSSDQIDLNFTNPEVLIQLLKVFLFYIKQGARVIRLDAIAYLWKQVGTSCINLPQTHEIVKLMRDIKEYLYPGIILITETNLPSRENLSYFGDSDEADMVYQFSLPPLLLHALFSGTSQYINQWISSISGIPSNCSFFNFTASHDGIGVRPLEGLLPQQEINLLTEAMKKAGGFVSMKRNSDGTNSPYEINITYFDSLKYSIAGPDNLQIERFICSQTLMMSLQGVPAFYIHSLLGTPNAYDEVHKTGMPRSINRKKWDSAILFPLLDSDSDHSKILKEIVRRILIRKKEKAFHPAMPQHIISANHEIFALTRGKNNEIIVLANLKPQITRTNFSMYGLSMCGATDLLSDNSIVEEEVILEPYQVLWIKKKS